VGKRRVELFEEGNRFEIGVVVVDDEKGVFKSGYLREEGAAEEKEEENFSHMCLGVYL